MYTEEEMLALDSAQLTRSKTKRALIPFILGAVVVVLLIGLIVGIAAIRNPGRALKGYSVTANDVMPVWSQSVLFNNSDTVKYQIHQLVRIEFRSV